MLLNREISDGMPPTRPGPTCLSGSGAAGRGVNKLRYPRGHEAPRRMCDVDVRTLAGPVPASPAVTAGPPPRLRDLVQRRRGQYDLLCDTRRRYGEIGGRADGP